MIFFGLKREIFQRERERKREQSKQQSTLLFSCFCFTWCYFFFLYFLFFLFFYFKLRLMNDLFFAANGRKELRPAVDTGEQFPRQLLMMYRNQPFHQLFITFHSLPPPQPPLPTRCRETNWKRKGNLLASESRSIDLNYTRKRALYSRVVHLSSLRTTRISRHIREYQNNNKK